MALQDNFRSTTEGHELIKNPELIIQKTSSGGFWFNQYIGRELLHHSAHDELDKAMEAVIEFYEAP